MGLLGKIVAAPLRTANVVVKGSGAILDVMCGEEPKKGVNSLDLIADAVEEAADDIVADKKNRRGHG